MGHRCIELNYVCLTPLTTMSLTLLDVIQTNHNEQLNCTFVDVNDVPMWMFHSIL